KGSQTSPGQEPTKQRAIEGIQRSGMPPRLRRAKISVLAWDLLEERICCNSGARRTRLVAPHLLRRLSDVANTDGNGYGIKEKIFVRQGREKGPKDKSQETGKSRPCHKANIGVRILDRRRAYPAHIEHSRDQQSQEQNQRRHACFR